MDAAEIGQRVTDPAREDFPLSIIRLPAWTNGCGACWARWWQRFASFGELCYNRL